jgi:multiple sugar transport system permease protein
MIADRKIVPLFLIAPANLLLVALIAVPSVHVIWLSFHQSSFGTGTVFIGLDNYYRIFADRIFWRAAVNTFIVVNIVVYAELVLSLVLALALSRKFYGRRLVFSLLIAPYAVTEVSAVVMWRYILEPDIGLFSILLSQIFAFKLNWITNPTHGLALISVLSVWVHLPFTFIIMYSALATVPVDLKDAARVEGATEWQVFLRVTMRVIAPAILVALMFRYIFAMRLFAEAWLLTEGGPARMTEVLGVYLFRAAFRYYDFGTAAATGIAMQAISLALASVYLYALFRRMRADA